MKMKIIALVAASLIAGGVFGFAHQPWVQTTDSYRWVRCPWTNVSGTAYTNQDTRTVPNYHRCHGRFQAYNNYGCCF
jgi:hypothetical protein